MSLVFFLFILNLQKFIHELGHFLLAKRVGITVKEFGIGYPPQATEIGQHDGTIFTFNFLLLGSFIKMLDEKDVNVSGNFASKSKLSRLSVLAIGPILNLITMCIFVTPAILFFTFANMSGVRVPVTGLNLEGEEASVATTVITQTMPNSPAENVGLQANDIVIGSDGVEFRYVGDLIAYVDKMKGQEINLIIEREDQLIQVPVSLRLNPPEGEGSLGVGISYQGVTDETEYYSLPIALAKGSLSAIEQSWRMNSRPYIVVIDKIIGQKEEFVRPTGFTENGLIFDGRDENGTRLFSVFRFLGIMNAGIIIPIVIVTVISLLPLPRWDSWRIIALIFEKE